VQRRKERKVLGEIGSRRFKEEFEANQAKEKLYLSEKQEYKKNQI
jgi:hypothetical protein